MRGLRMINRGTALASAFTLLPKRFTAFRLNRFSMKQN